MLKALPISTEESHYDYQKAHSRVEQLVLIHRTKNDSKLEARHVQLLGEHTFSVESCLRYFWLTSRSESDHYLDTYKQNSTFNVFEGVEAYQFLLSIALGLESEMIGETDIFGQIKDAWNKRELGTSLEKYLHGIMQDLYTDTKDIRTQFVQNIGGCSYGSIARKLLKERYPNAKPARILMVGAGQLAKTLLPWIANTEVCQELWLINRTKSKAEMLQDELGISKEFTKMAIFEADQEESLLQLADVIVYCVPFDDEKDVLRIKTLTDKTHVMHTVMHLGGRRREAHQDWLRVQNLFMLDEFFEIQKNAQDVRSEQIEKARNACRERAQLRGLGSSLSLAHGWEDLALFV